MRGVTGTLRVSRESIFSGLNNLAVYTLVDVPFSTCFGFTEAEGIRWKKVRVRGGEAEPVQDTPD